MSVQWTKEQQKVIDLRDSNILVSAAAGSVFSSCSSIFPAGSRFPSPIHFFTTWCTRSGSNGFKI